VLTPSFLLGLFVLLVFVRYVGPTLEIRFVLLDPGLDVFDPRRLIAPALVLSARPMAFMAQVTIGALQDVVPAGYIRTAYAKGLPYRMILRRHMLRNIALPVLSALNASFFFALSSIFVIEWLFNWNGVGFHLLQSVLERDTLLASYLLIFIAVTMFLVNTVIELAIRQIDRRLPEIEGFGS
jgi:peptide/nickel transport system permease protein